jgi:hypothetical protein
MDRIVVREALTRYDSAQRRCAVTGDLDRFAEEALP